MVRVLQQAEIKSNEGGGILGLKKKAQASKSLVMFIVSFREPPGACQRNAHPGSEKAEPGGRGCPSLSPWKSASKSLVPPRDGGLPRLEGEK